MCDYQRFKLKNDSFCIFINTQIYFSGLLAGVLSKGTESRVPVHVQEKNAETRILINLIPFSSPPPPLVDAHPQLGQRAAGRSEKRVCSEESLEGHKQKIHTKWRLILLNKNNVLEMFHDKTMVSFGQILVTLCYLNWIKLKTKTKGMKKFRPTD